MNIIHFRANVKRNLNTLYIRCEIITHKFLCQSERQFVYRVPLLLQDHKQGINLGREAVNYATNFQSAIQME